jgi:hypothetical protein
VARVAGDCVAELDLEYPSQAKALCRGASTRAATVDQDETPTGTVTLNVVGDREVATVRTVPPFRAAAPGRSPAAPTDLLPVGCLVKGPHCLFRQRESCVYNFAVP